MDIRCAKCGIEAKFDDARVPPHGVTVKCSSCGHMFKVRPKDAAGAGDAVRGSGEWMVKSPKGDIVRFRELTTLQKWIVERKVGRADMISKSGRTWRTLGEIAELESFFLVVEAADAAARLTNQSVVTSSPLLDAALTAPPAALTPPPIADMALHYSLDPDVVDNAQDAARTLEQLQASSSSSWSSASPVSLPRAADLPGADLGEDDPVAAWQRSAARWRMGAALLTLVGIFLGAGLVTAERRSRAGLLDPLVVDPLVVDPLVVDRLVVSVPTRPPAAVAPAPIAPAPTAPALPVVALSIPAMPLPVTSSPTSASAPAPADAGRPAAPASGAKSADGDGESYEALMIHATALQTASKSSQALPLFRRAQAMRPREARPWLGMGWALLDLSQFDDAAARFASALQRDPKLAEARFGEAEALRFSGQKERAIEAYKRYLEAQPAGADADVARNALKTLE